ncbi:uncharacterized protein DUF1837 [Pedobacter psychrotolerans]|uniref:Uncharacterized protein DUF1837 n=1 Tax=Pedobacter psychrotolerans TaxID=1843235 RepID=A0A4R2H402_9SPHI|nr:DUF1837 domain-containing protein [Pedobacter psychrotolerans]TCO19833.1 uncharacterized protein DUF1837 [Pedobacter psychrotolerans]GGE49200.1 hypothetical protein GCM10011413_14210 [Pedobacter psychrotolerans]
MDFEILINNTFSDINSNDTLSPITNKSVISMINNFEDSEWRYNHFQNFIWDNIAETSLSYNERESLINSHHSLLTYAAKNLRLSDKTGDISKGSEIAEIVLYAIMKHHFNSLPVVPKIFYKQNAQDNAKGADSVHIIIENGNDFSIWFGEAKFYNSIEDTRIPEIITSVENSLSTEKLKKENSIITNVSDIDLLIDDEILRNKIKSALSPRESIDLIKPKLHIPILLLHECEITKKHTVISDLYKDDIIEFHKKRAESYFKKQIDKLGTLPHYSEIKFHLIFFPVPLKKIIVDRFVSMADFYKNS